MNFRNVIFILGWVLNMEAVLMVPSMVTGLIYQERAVTALLWSALLCLAIGIPMSRIRRKNTHFRIREGFVAVALCWIAISVMGGLPFLFSGTFTNPVDALFETMSGFTTTGASVLTDVEVVPRCIIFWRSFTHWIGGMGVLVFLLSLFRMTGGSHINLMKAESPGPSVGRLLPTIQSTAKVLYIIYFGMTVLMVVLLLLGRMPLFDALTISFGTAGTGGFGIKNDSLGSYTVYQQVVVTVFMLLFGVNFNVYFFMLARKWKNAFRCEELWWYLGIVAVSILTIGWNIRGMFDNLGQAMQQSAFQVASIITTTGYATTDFNLWPETSRSILVLLMFVGACAGSTGGGMKVSRLVILLKTVKKELSQFLHPGRVAKIRMDGKVVEHETIRSINVFMVAYLLIFSLSVLALSFDGTDMITNFTAVAATFNNIGPGLEQAGPATNFAMFSNVSKLVMTFDMLAGRLEIFPLLLLFVRDTWRKF